MDDELQRINLKIWTDEQARRSRRENFLVACGCVLHVLVMIESDYTLIRAASGVVLVVMIIISVKD